MTADLPLDPHGHVIAAQALAQPLGFASSTASPRHVAIIMDGNGRWAAQRGFPRLEGHRQGVEAVRRTVRAAIEQGVPYLTLFSFSSENWSRPEDEVSGLMGLLKRFIRSDLAQLHESGVRIRILGRRDRVEPEIIRLIEEAEALTAENTALGLNVAFNYGGRDEIVRAARALAEQVQAGTLDAGAITEAALTQSLDTAGIPDPDLLIRTSGEQRISNFLLWQCAYAELVFLDCLWPDFDNRALQQAIHEFRSRERRFGGVIARTSA